VARCEKTNAVQACRLVACLDSPEAACLGSRAVAMQVLQFLSKLTALQLHSCYLSRSMVLTVFVC
jgi:hypothetical protein